MRKFKEEKFYYNEFASLYDYYQKGVENDVNFYLDYFKNFKGKILEIGAGTGRITIPLLKQGLNITALDIAPKMLQILKEKAKKENLSVKTICADIRNFKLKNKFDAIIVTYRTFQHMYSFDDQFKALKNIKKHLKPNGVLIFDVYAPNLKYIVQGNWQWRKDDIIKVPGINDKIRIDFRNRYDIAEQMMYQEYRFTYPDGKEKIVPLRMRFFFRFEIENLLRLAGFKVKNLYGDFKKSKFKNGSPEMVWVAKPMSK